MIIHKPKKALVLKLRDPERVTAVIPKARVFEHEGVQYVAVKHGVEEVQVLNNLGINAPSPVKWYYHWPGRFKPFAHQKDTAAFLTMYNRAFCLNGMGTGKTHAALWAYDYLRSQGLVHKALVITPLSTLERTWADAVFDGFSHLDTAVLYGSREKRMKMLDTDADIYLINHDGIKVSGFVEAMSAREDIDLIIIDEIAQVARNAGTDRYKALNNIVNRQVSRRAWGLTGTPTPNGPTDAWAQCRLMVPEKVPPYFNRFRDAVMRQINQFLWVPRPNALDVVHEAMQPSIRFALEECIDLPECVFETRQAELTSGQQKAYKEMLTKLKVEAEAGEILAVNEAVKAQKLIQIACLCYDTLVLTTDGWVPIQDITREHVVWDGVEWVRQEGAVYNGDKKVVSCFGVLMTEGHKVLTERGWITAKEVTDEQAKACSSGSQGKGLDRERVRLPYRDSSRRVNDTHRSVLETRNVVVSLRMRQRGSESKPVSSNETPPHPEELWVSSRERNAQDVEYTTVSYLVRDEKPLHEPKQQRLEKLWRSWNNGVRTVGYIVSEFLRRHVLRVRPWINSRQNKQQRAVFAGELPMGDSGAAGEQPEVECIHRHPTGENDSNGIRSKVRVEESNLSSSPEQVQVVSRKSTVNSGDVAPVYDLINCGPRSRFVVLGGDGHPLIVHNCGIAYSTNGEEILFDAEPRMKLVQEIVEEAGTKTIVFAPFVSSVKGITEYLRNVGFSVECITGETSKSERDRILGAFQKMALPQVIVASPGTMSHGLTLTAANTIVWAAPISSNDIFEQANARVRRPGQKHAQLIVMIEGTEIERKYYQRLKDKQKTQGVLLDMVQSARSIA